MEHAFEFKGSFVCSVRPSPRQVQDYFWAFLLILGSPREVQLSINISKEISSLVPPRTLLRNNELQKRKREKAQHSVGFKPRTANFQIGKQLL